MGSKKTKSSSVSVSTPNNPAWVEPGVANLFQRSQQLGSSDPHQFVPGANTYQTDAAQRAQELTRQAAPQIQTASLLDGLDNYMSPYRDDVVSAAMADFDTEAARTRIAQELALAGAGAFGGSGAALTKSLTEGELSRARNTQASTLLDQMFNRAATLSGDDANRRQSAALANAQLEAANRDQQLAATQLQGERGDVLRQADYELAQAPLSLASWEAAIQAGLPLSLFQGNTTKSDSTTKDTDSPLDMLQKAVNIASGLAPMFKTKPA